MAAECDSGLDGPASDGGDAGTFAFPNVAATFLATFFATGAGATAFLAIAFFAGTNLAVTFLAVAFFAATILGSDLAAASAVDLDAALAEASSSIRLYPRCCTAKPISLACSRIGA